MLIVTIIVIIILAAAVILTLSKNNPIESAREARFKEDIMAMQDEFSMYLSSQYSKNPTEFDPLNVNISGDELKEVLSNAEEYEGEIEVLEGKLFYVGTNSSKSEQQWANNLEVRLMYGDCNEDGKVNDEDASYLNQKITTNAAKYDSLTRKQQMLYDVRKDGVIDTLDVSILQVYIQGEISSLPVIQKSN